MNQNHLKRTLSLVLAFVMMITLVPLGAFTALADPAAPPAADATTSATYYKKANWENRIKDKSRWPIGNGQRLVRVSTSEPVEMNDIDYDGNFVDANGRTVLRLVYKEKGAAATAVWYRALFNFGELDQFIDYDLSYLVGANDDAKIVLTPFNDREERMVDIGVARGLLTQQRKNLPINLVLKEGVTIDTLGKKNYIVQMRLTDKNGVRVYSYAPKGTAMDYSTYTKTTSVSLEDKVNRLFIKGGLQNDGNDATNQEFFMSEFIANPEQYDDGSNLGIIRTQYMGQRSGTKQSPTVGGEPIAFTQAFDAKLLDYLKPDGKGNVAYVNVLENSRLKSKWSHDFGFKIKDFNKSADGKLAYLVIAPNAFQKDGVNKVEIEKHDQFTMIQGFYITAIDYVVDKAKFEDTFAGKTAGIDATRKLNYSTISGWTNPNKDGWVVFEKDFADGYVANEGESYIIDTTTDPQGGQIMIKIGNDDAIIRRTQGYYTGSVLGNAGIEKIAKFTDGIYTFDLREGATVSAGDKLKVYMPYTKEHAGPVNFLEIHNGTKLNKGAATLKLLTNRKINMHLYKEDKKGHFVLKYTLADGKESSKKFEPKLTWQYDNKDKVMTGVPNGSTLSTGGNFYIDTEKLQPGADIFVESYDEKGNEIPEQKSWFKYKPIAQSTERVEGLTWTDHSDTSSILSVNKSLYTPYQVLFTNDYAEGTDDFYKDPRVLPDDNAKFNTDTTEFVGYTKYDGGKVRTIYDEGRTPKLIAKVQADEDEYNDKGELTKESAKKIMIPKEEIFDPNFNETSKEYTAYEYKVNLAKMLEYNSADKTDKSLTLLKDMKFVSNASDGSSLPSDYYETRVRARVLFDTTDGEFADHTKKAVKIVPDNIKFYGEDGYTANGFEGDNVEANTGDKFPEAPTLAGKNFLGWVTETAKNKLSKTTVTAEEFNALTKDEIFSEDTPVTKHLVVYAIYSDDVTVTLDANGGKFDDGKEEHTAKAVDSTVTVAKEPTKEGYTFKGWAATKDAKEADSNILTGVTAPKTVYAVWEKTEKTPLELTAPTPVEVKDLKGLTSDEIDKVKKAVADANKDKGITEADVTVAEDGTVTVTKDGKTGTLTPKQTVKQKEVKNEFNPPKEPVPVDEIGNLKPDEIAAIRQAVKDANPDRNFKDDEITVKPDGTVEINQGGKVGTIPADKTVVQKDTILKLEAPEKTEVKDITNLTKEERDKVAAAVKTKNNLPNTATIDVDSKGNVTVTDGTKTGKLKAEDTVKPFTREKKTLNPPAQKVKVSDKTNLTEKEKQDVRDAIKTANPDLDFKDNEIQVDEDGTVTVPMGETNVGTIPGTETVEEITDADKTIKLLEPEKTVVADKTKLTPQEKTAVKEAVKKANPTLNLQDDEIEVAEDGSVTVTRGEGENQKVGQLSQEDTVVENLKKPEATALRDGSVVVTPKDDRTEELEITFGDAANPTKVTAIKENGKWKLADGTDPSITIDEATGLVTIPAKMLKNNDEVKAKAKAKAGKLESEEAIVNSNDTTAPKAPTVEAKDDGSVKVTPPTDADTKEVSVTYTPTGATDPVTVTATKEGGKWKLPQNAPEGITIDENTGVITIPADKVADESDVKAKAKDNSNNESDEATAKTKKDTADTTAPGKPTISAEDDGSVKVTPPTDADTKEV
ncbi:InlB B-repeat-containing protein, partial [Peptoniphilus sp.]|uniref:InlB B-repeat-containing protein n=1 Tax=Peptoniphilus sp. TaxID=1971214 RepID=UPI003992D832